MEFLVFNEICEFLECSEIFGIKLNCWNCVGIFAIELGFFGIDWNLDVTTVTILISGFI